MIHQPHQRTAAVAMLSALLGAGSTHGAVITYLSSTRYISANTSRVDAVGFADFNETVFFSTPPTGVGTSQASQQSQLLQDRIVARCATRTTSEFFMLPPAFLVAQSFLDVTFRVDESTPYSIYSGEFLDETLMGGASVALYRGSDLTNLLVGINQQSPPVGGVLTPGVYRFRAIATSEPAGGGGGSNSFGRALATATLVVPSPAAAGLLVALGLISARRCRA